MVAIVEYNAGNTMSVQRAFAEVGCESVIVSDPEKLLKMDKIVFPGVGAAGSAMKVLRERGLDEVLKEVVKKGTLLLGICLGAQILLTRSQEGDTPCLGLIEGVSTRFSLPGSYAVPHMGWNTIEITSPSPLLPEKFNRGHFYFVHSYFLDVAFDVTLATTTYGCVFPSVIGKGSIFGVQFHPEKSGRIGLEFLKNFCSL